MSTASHPRRHFINTFGCQMNVYDSEHLSTLLSQHGWIETQNREEADFIFLNTCSVREKAAQRVITFLQNLIPLKRKRPDLLVGVGGCVAEQEGGTIIQKIPYVNLVVGPRRLNEIPETLKTLTAHQPPRVLIGESTQNTPIKQVPLKSQAPLSSFITIMQGCNNYCAYCVVPLLRGPEHSRKADDIFMEAKDLLERGTREITLLGQNVNSYAHNLKDVKQNFFSLLTSLNTLPNLWRLRFTTSHPKDFPPELISAFGQLQCLCEHLQLPLQSGSDSILKAMGRHYDRKHYLSLIEKLRKSCPNLALGTDIIVGFPGETEADFNQTLDILKEIHFDSIFSFQYSDRPGTRSLSMPNKISEEEKNQRLLRLQEFQQKISLEKNQALIGTPLEVLVEDRGRNSGQLRGRGRNFKIVNFEGHDELIGKLVTVNITQATAVSLGGTLIPSR